MTIHEAKELDDLLSDFRITDKPFEAKYKIADWIDNYIYSSLKNEKIFKLKSLIEKRKSELEIKIQPEVGTPEYYFTNGESQAYCNLLFEINNMEAINKLPDMDDFEKGLKKDY